MVDEEVRKCFNFGLKWINFVNGYTSNVNIGLKSLAKMATYPYARSFFYLAVSVERAPSFASTRTPVKISLLVDCRLPRVRPKGDTCAVVDTGPEEIVGVRD